MGSPALGSRFWDQLSGISGAVPTVRRRAAWTPPRLPVTTSGSFAHLHGAYDATGCTVSLRLVCDVLGAQVAFLTAASLISWTLQQYNAHIFVAVYSSIDIGYRCVTSWS